MRDAPVRITSLLVSLVISGQVFCFVDDWPYSLGCTLWMIVVTMVPLLRWSC